ncbi:unnamed protein product, partial [Rotaria sordida]
DESKINDKPIFSNPSSEQDESKPAELNSNQIPADRLVSRLDITIVDTTDGQYPKGVILDIQACTEVVTETTTVAPLSTISSTTVAPLSTISSTTVTPLSIISSTTERPAETEITSITTGITGTQSSQPEETSS